jgi:hypothetical protein
VLRDWTGVYEQQWTFETIILAIYLNRRGNIKWFEQLNVQARSSERLGKNCGNIVLYNEKSFEL